MPMTRDEAIAALTAPGEPYELEWVVESGRRARTGSNSCR